MLIALTGLHGSGKSYFANNIPSKFGFIVYNKQQVIEYICKEETGRDDWLVWYREQYNKNPYSMTTKILSCLPLDKDIILDAVHSYKEWQIIQSVDLTAMIVVVTTPEHIRAQRREEEDKVKDIQRIGYWHNADGDSVGCLLTQVSWSFNGAASMENNERSFSEFIDCIHCKKSNQGLQGIGNFKTKQKKI